MALSRSSFLFRVFLFALICIGGNLDGFQPVLLRLPVCDVRSSLESLSHRNVAAAAAVAVAAVAVMVVAVMVVAAQSRVWET